MRAGLETSVLKGVSRSFYLSLRLLPEAMRRPAGIGYLLARVSDTIADTAWVSADERMAALENFSRQVAGDEVFSPVPGFLIGGTRDIREKLLLGRVGDVLDALSSLSQPEISLIREVLRIIISGQRLDLERFGNANPSATIALTSDDELEDYTWRVAGCVGEFWTKLGYLTLGEKFSLAPEAELLKYAVNYGKSLQLVNILRDLPEDLVEGRCYLPVVGDPADQAALMDSFSKWREIALGGIDSAFSYAQRLESHRLRAASILPGLIAKKTLGLLEGVDFETLRNRIKVPRHKVYFMVFRALVSRGSEEMKRT